MQTTIIFYNKSQIWKIIGHFWEFWQACYRTRGRVTNSKRPHQGLSPGLNLSLSKLRGEDGSDEEQPKPFYSTFEKY